MAKKCIEILMVVMIELCILIVIKTQANNLNSTSFAHSSPIMILHFSEPDEAQNPGHHEQEPKPYQKAEYYGPKLPLPSCIAKKIEYCKEKHKPIHDRGAIMNAYGYCLFGGFQVCLHITNDYGLSIVFESCISDCWIHHVWKNHNYDVMHFVACLELCYETHIKNYRHNF